MQEYTVGRGIIIRLMENDELHGHKSSLKSKTEAIN